MLDPNELIAARGCGQIRYAVVSDRSGDLSQVLTKFGLETDKLALIEIDRATATSILSNLLWQDMAYSSECMPEERAEAFAKQVMDDHSCSESRYFSNKDFTPAFKNGGSWNPLTASTFDSGLIISGTNSIYFCIWFEDED